MALCFEGVFYCGLDGDFLEVGHLFGDGVVFGVMGEVGFASCRVWGFAAPVI